VFKQSRSSRVPPGLEGEMRAVETKGHASMRRITFGLTSSSLIFEAARRSWRQLIAASLLGPAMAAAKRGRCSRFSSGCAKAILARQLLRMAATERGRGHDHQKDSNHALMRALATAGPVMGQRDSESFPITRGCQLPQSASQLCTSARWRHRLPTGTFLGRG
jgi:hypothetical protein